eukprot:scaffold13295_cov36-Cyclotella_meneghiniana.AAC.1
MSRGQYLNDYSTLIDASFSNNTFKGTKPGQDQRRQKPWRIGKAANIDHDQYSQWSFFLHSDWFGSNIRMCNIGCCKYYWRDGFDKCFGYEGAILMLVSIYSRGLAVLSFGAIMMFVNIYLAPLHTFLHEKRDGGSSGSCNVTKSEFLMQRTGCSAPEFLR